MRDKDAQLMMEAYEEASVGNNTSYVIAIFSGPHGGHARKIESFDNLDDAVNYAKHMAAEAGEGDEWVEHGVQWDTSPEVLEYLRAFADTIPELANAVAEWQFGQEYTLVAVKNSSQDYSDKAMRNPNTPYPSA